MTPEQQEHVRKLAESLKKQGLASSMADAERQARQMLGIDEILPRRKEPTAQDIIDTAEEPGHEEQKKRFEQKELEEDFDITQSEKTVKELLAEEEKETEEVEGMLKEAENIEKEEEKIEKEEKKEAEDIEKVEENIEKEKEEEKEIKEDIEKEEQREEKQAKAEAKELTQKEKEGTDLTKIFNVNK